MPNLLVDTGAVVAYLDRSEKFHLPCLDLIRNFRGRLISTEAVLTESLHLLNDSFENQKKCFDLFLNAVRIVPASIEDMQRCLALMEKYQDIPMDFADATLVSLAEDLDCGEIFTLDHRGFQTYRWKGKRHFTLHPS